MFRFKLEITFFKPLVEFFDNIVGQSRQIAVQLPQQRFILPNPHLNSLQLISVQRRFFACVIDFSCQLSRFFVQITNFHLVTVDDFPLFLNAPVDFSDFLLDARRRLFQRRDRTPDSLSFFIEMTDSQLQILFFVFKTVEQR